MQTADYPDYEVEKEQQKLNALYDTFSKKYGLINSRANVSAFSQDSSFALLSALEVLDENGELERKADMFTKRTIKPHTPVTSVDTASEALAVSMGEKACVDMEYMCSLTGKTEQEIYGELKGVIFLNPMYGYGGSDEQKYLMADEYLSGNVREKLAWAKKSAEVYPEDYNINVEALEKVQPKDLTASEIFVQLGTTWLPEEIAQQFMYEFLDTPVYARWNIKVHYSKLTGEWNVEGKSYDRGNLKAYNTYGTKRVNAYKIIEDTPEGTGYRAKTRFAKFNNLPELMAMFKQVADIKTADMLDLPVPEVEYHNIAVKPSQVQKEMVASLGERAEKIRGGNVDSSVDNMLKVTNDGRKLALDQRMMNPMLPDEEGSKVNACVNEVFRIWEENSDKKLTQLLFCDLSTPKGAGEFSVYTDIRQKLIERGIPESEIKFIHEADTETKKQELFKKVRRGEVRILMGSTQKMGAGTNVQNKIIASHDLDCPWRPADLEQRAGRTVRQGNENPKVGLYRYVTEGTFDAYCWQLVEGKQKFASQIMTSKSPVRSCEDVDATALSYAEIKMLAADNPHIKEKMDLDIQVQKLRLLKSNYLSEKYELEDKIIKYYPTTIARTKETIAGLEKDISLAKEHPKPLDDTFVGIEVKGVSYSEKAEGGQKIIDACKEMTSPDPIPLGKYRGFDLELSFDTFEKAYQVKIKGSLSRSVSLGTDAIGNITRIDNAIEKIPERLEAKSRELSTLEQQFVTAKAEVEKPFDKEEELTEKTNRLNVLNGLLNVDKRENELVDGAPDEGDSVPVSKERAYER